MLHNEARKLLVEGYKTTHDAETIGKIFHEKASSHNSATRVNVPFRCLASIFDRGIGSRFVTDLKTFRVFKFRASGSCKNLDLQKVNLRFF